MQKYTALDNAEPLQHAEISSDTENGHSVLVVAPSHSSHILTRVEYLSEICNNYDVIFAPRKSFSIPSSLSYKFTFINELRQRRASVFHSHYTIADSTLLAFIVGKFPMLITTMGADILYHEQGDPTKFLAAAGKCLLKNSDAITVKSEHNARHVESFGVKREKIHKIVWGIDQRVYFPINQDRAWLLKQFPENLSKHLKDKKVILQPRGAPDVYNNGLILEALKTLKTSGRDDFILWLPKALGQPESSLIQTQAAELGLADNILLSPALNASQMNLAFNLADVTISVASSDGLPMTILESLAAGTPVIAAKLPHFEDELGPMPIHWSTFDSNNICENLTLALRSEVNQSNSQALSEQCSKEFDLSNDLSTYAAILTDLAEQKSQSKHLPRMKVLVLYFLDKLTRRVARMVGRKKLDCLYVRQRL